MRVSFHPSALDELHAAAAWYDACRVGLGTSFVEAVEHALNHISKAPERWPLVPLEPRARRYVLRRFPYVLFYTVLNGAVFVLAVSHSSRKPGYWKRRLGAIEDS